MRHFTYTYSEGRRLPLGRRASHFISRATHDQLIRDAFRPIEPLSRHSWSVLTQTEQLDIDILRARHLAPAYSFYLDAENETDFLVTDRLFLRVRPSADVEALAKKHQFEILKGLSYRDYLVRVDPRVDVVDVDTWIDPHQIVTIRQPLENLELVFLCERFDICRGPHPEKQTVRHKKIGFVFSIEIKGIGGRKMARAEDIDIYLCGLRQAPPGTPRQGLDGAEGIA